MTVSQAVEEFLTYFSSVKGMSENSVNAYRNDLENFCTMEFIGKERPIGEITENDILSCIGVLSAKKRKSTSINRFISSVRSLFLYCRNFGYIDINPASEIKNVKVPATLPNFMTGNEVDEICRQPLEKEILWASRDNAIFEMFYSSGCRISELAALKTGDFLKDLSSAVVHGKGGKDRHVFFSKDAVESLKNYIIEKDSRFGSFTLKDRNAFIFVNQRGTALSARGIRFILSKYSGPEGTKRHINPHAFRHTFATALISNGADVRLVQELLGHSSISTTQRYTHISTDRLIEMYNKSHPHGDKKNN